VIERRTRLTFQGVFSRKARFLRLSPSGGSNTILHFNRVGRHGAPTFLAKQDNFELKIRELELYLETAKLRSKLARV
jgi:hypothetical protein